MKFDVRINNIYGTAMMERILLVAGVHKKDLRELMNELLTTGNLELREIGQNGHTIVTPSKD